MTPPLRWGILSTADIARRIVDGARSVESAEVVAVGSRVRARADAYAAAHAIPRAHGSYEALLEDPEVDAIYNALPNGLHVPWSVRALEAGKHVLCEKPMGRRADEVAAAFDLAEARGRLLTEGFMWRFQPQTEALVDLVRGGAVGELRTVRVAFGFTLEQPGDPRWIAALDGGALMDVGSYCVSALRLLCGEPERVGAEAVPGGEGVDVRFAGVLRFADDVLGIFDCGFDVLPGPFLDVLGSQGRVRTSDPFAAASPRLTLTRADGPEETVEPEPVDPYAAELADFAAAAAGERPPRLCRDECVGQARTIEALYRAAAEGRAITP